MQYEKPEPACQLYPQSVNLTETALNMTIGLPIAVVGINQLLVSCDINEHTTVIRSDALTPALPFRLGMGSINN